jgi:hypothetical protein
MDTTLLEQLLKMYGISVAEWGAGDAKTVSHLLKEIEDGESKLVAKRDKLMRQLAIMTIWVYSPDRSMVLKEDRQEFKDGRVRRRGHLSGSVTEKVKRDEEMDLAAVARALKEELGDCYVDSLRYIGADIQEENSMSYPGLTTVYKQAKYDVTLSYANAEGYVEVQKDKSTFFVWVPA